MKRIVSFFGVLAVTVLTAFGQFTNVGKTVMYDSQTYRFLEANLIASNNLVVSGGANVFTGTNVFSAITLGGVTQTDWPSGGGVDAGTTNYFRNWANQTNTPSTLSGYGITDSVWLGSSNFVVNSTITATNDGRSVWGNGIDVTNINASAYGASQHGKFDSGGTMTIGSGSYGASQNGRNAVGFMYIGLNSFGASQQGQNNGSMIIGNSAYGANQKGHVQAGALATNNAIGALQLFNLISGQTSIVTSAGDASIVLGAGVSSNKNAIVAGDVQESHGDGSISASGGFWDNGIRVGGGTVTFATTGTAHVAVSAAANAIVLLTMTNNNCIIDAPVGPSDGRKIEWRVTASNSDWTIYWPTNIFKIPSSSTMTTNIVVSNATTSVFLMEYDAGRTRWLMQSYIWGY